MINICGGGCNLHSEGCWGYFVVRTSFDEDDDNKRVEEAMAKLKTYTLMEIDRTRRHYQDMPHAVEIDAEAVTWHHNVLIDDIALKDASLEQIRVYMNSWFETLPGGNDGSLRYITIILLDREVIANLIKLPESQAMEEWLDMIFEGRDTQWVKLVDTDVESGESCRAYVWDLPKIFWMLGHNDFGVSEMPTNPGEDPDWCFFDGL